MANPAAIAFYAAFSEHFYRCDETKDQPLRRADILQDVNFGTGATGRIA